MVINLSIWLDVPDKTFCNNNDALIEKDKDVCVNNGGEFYKANTKKDYDSAIGFSIFLSFLIGFVGFIAFKAYQ